MTGFADVPFSQIKGNATSNQSLVDNFAKLESTTQTVEAAAFSIYDSLNAQHYDITSNGNTLYYSGNLVLDQTTGAQLGDQSQIVGMAQLNLFDVTADAYAGLTVDNGELLLAGNPVGGSAGTKTYAVFTATDNQPPSSNFATLDTRNSIAVLDFDAATDEFAVFLGVIPEAADLASGLKVRIYWMATSATSGNCRWGVQFEKAGTDLDSDSFDSATEAHSAANGTSGIETVTEITATSIDSLAAGDRFRLKVFRNADDATNDTMTGDAELIAVEVRNAI